jgi:hypothetical protein
MSFDESSDIRLFLFIAEVLNFSGTFTPPIITKNLAISIREWLMDWSSG